LEQKDWWSLPQDLETLHDAIIDYAVRVHAAAKHKATLPGPVSNLALLNLHENAIIIHRAIRSVCEAGWTPTSPILIRTLLDILANTYAIVSNEEDAEYMAFKFMSFSFIQRIKDPDTPGDARAADNEEVNKLRSVLQKRDIERIDELVTNYKPRSYWFRPEFKSPGEIFKHKMPHLFIMYRQFSGSIHGAFIGSLLFHDSPDDSDIGAHEHPLRTRDAVVASSRLLLDISWARGKFKGLVDDTEWTHIMKTLILPQSEKGQTRRLGL
jgi:hypothetical protein